MTTTRALSGPLRIVKLTAENVKRLRAVEITPTGDLVTITGRNAAGKSSVLDAIWLALGGAPAQRGTTKPIRDGEDHARVVLDLGELVVTRTWKADKSTLAVTAADGAIYSSPQGILDALVGKLAFDPLAFTRLSAREQREALLGLVDLDIDLAEVAAKRADLYDWRTRVGREIKGYGDIGEPNGDLPTEEQSAGDLLAEIRVVEARRRDLDDVTRKFEAARDRHDRIAADIARLTDELAQTETDLTALSRRQVALKFTERDTGRLEAKLADLEISNARIRHNNARRAERDKVKQLTAEYSQYGVDIAALDQRKADALAKAEFPVAGLGFDDSGVTFRGVPFAQASAAEQIRVSLGMAMALNPTLRVIRILDGSLLDDDSMRMVAAAAREGGYQVWIEVVGSRDASAIVIEDGEVAP